MSHIDPKKFSKSLKLCTEFFGTPYDISSRKKNQKYSESWPGRFELKR